MLATLARGTFLLILAMLFVAWALSLGKEVPSQPQEEQTVESVFC